MDSRRKSVAKTISWRVVAIALTIPLVFMVTGDLSLSLGVGALDTALKTAGFYVHERFWEHLAH